KSDPSEVQYGETKNYGLIASGTAFQGNGKLGAIHEVLLKELKPDTVYHYRVGGEGQWSGDYTFKTAPADLCKPVTFIALGDDRSDDSSGPNAKWGPILMQASDENPSFILNTGDLVKDGGEVDQWINWLEMSDPSPAQIPHMPVLGNHDDGPGEGDGANYNQIFNLPRNDVYNNEDFYFFTYGNIFVAGLSTQTFEEGNPPFSKQAEWLDKALTENPRMWKFVFFHHPNYTSYKDLFGLDLNHPPNEQTQNAALVPIFDKHHVDFVFSGHNHYYERFKPMKGGGGSNKGGDIVDSPDKGTQYIITGGAGALTYGLLNAVSLICAGTYASTKCAGEHHYVKITVENTKITLTVQATAAQLLGTDPKNSKVIETVSP
ncbi:MAG: metallophosphoesterase family protein, partial [Deltaproteobacteria bacterium]|nr:metallophosphoesterase family protein [Deltaproteobacteria bacterium]